MTEIEILGLGHILFRSSPESQSHLSLTSKKRPRQEAHTIRNIGGAPRHFFVPNLT
jgi:hypothetical protein